MLRVGGKIFCWGKKLKHTIYASGEKVIHRFCLSGSFGWIGRVTDREYMGFFVGRKNEWLLYTI